MVTCVCFVGTAASMSDLVSSCWSLRYVTALSPQWSRIRLELWLILSCLDNCALENAEWMNRRLLILLGSTFLHMPVALLCKSFHPLDIRLAFLMFPWEWQGVPPKPSGSLGSDVLDSGILREGKCVCTYMCACMCPSTCVHACTCMHVCECACARVCVCASCACDQRDRRGSGSLTDTPWAVLGLALGHVCLSLARPEPS